MTGSRKRTPISTFGVHMPAQWQHSAEYPAEHIVAHDGTVMPQPMRYDRAGGPTSGFNPGVGVTPAGQHLSD